MKTLPLISRKQLITQTAVHLFTEKGNYEKGDWQVSTQLLAKAAWLSESLTLKHFGTNEHLLTSIITAGY